MENGFCHEHEAEYGREENVTSEAVCLRNHCRELLCIVLNRGECGKEGRCEHLCDGRDSHFTPFVALCVVAESGHAVAVADDKEYMFRKEC